MVNVNKTVCNINLIEENLQQVMTANNLVLTKQDTMYLANFYLNNRQRIETNITEEEYVGYGLENLLLTERLIDVEAMTGIKTKVKVLYI